MSSDIRLNSGAILKKVHPRGTCLLDHCAIHNPSEHPLKDAPMEWIGGSIRHLVRVCEHGFSHPDPDDISFKKAIGDWFTVEAISSVHLVEEACDGCCRATSLIADTPTKEN